MPKNGRLRNMAQCDKQVPAVQTQDIQLVNSMLDQCWVVVIDGGPTLNKHLVGILQKSSKSWK